MTAITNNNTDITNNTTFITSNTIFITTNTTVTITYWLKDEELQSNGHT